MTKTMTLLIAGMLAAGSVATLSAQQQQQQPPKPTQAHFAPKPAATMATRTTGHDWTTAQIKDVQTDLTRARLYSGKISGVLDSATRTAMREFQRAHNLPVTGLLSDSLLVELRQQKPKP